MHKCSKCGRAATSLEEIDAGCPCGSKVFVFDRQIAQAGPSSPAMGGQPEIPQAAAGAPSPVQVALDAAQPPSAGNEQTVEGKQEGNGHAPDSYHARTTFTNDDIENIKVLTQGVFLLDVNAISKNPVVLKDEDEIYYVKLPLVQKKASAPVPPGEGNGKKE